VLIGDLGMLQIKSELQPKDINIEVTQFSFYRAFDYILSFLCQIVIYLT